MNPFAIAVITLQILAAIKYAYDRSYPDAFIWLGAAIINIAILSKR